MFKVSNKFHGVHFATIASWLIQNRNKVVIRSDIADVTALPGLFKPELQTWLEGRNYSAWWYDGFDAAWLALEFADANDSLLFKLTWSGT